MSRSSDEPTVPLGEVRMRVVARLRSRRAEIEEALVARILNVASDPTGTGDVKYEEGGRG
ncbi:MAG: hypothetical protein WB709_01780 [Solirubrobacteraceae bacterium]